MKRRGLECGLAHRLPAEAKWRNVACSALPQGSLGHMSLASESKATAPAPVLATSASLSMNSSLLSCKRSERALRLEEQIKQVMLETVGFQAEGLLPSGSRLKTSGQAARTFAPACGISVAGNQRRLSVHGECPGPLWATTREAGEQSFSKQAMKRRGLECGLAHRLPAEAKWRNVACSALPQGSLGHMSLLEV